MNELQQREGTSDDKKKVLEMLQRLEEEDNGGDGEENWEDLDSDDDLSEEGDLADRLAEVDLNNADAIWERLTDAEKQEFKSIVYNGEIENIVQHVEPWWNNKLEEKLIQDVKEDEKAVKKILEKCPKAANVKEFQKMSVKSPAPCIIYNIANVISAYTCIFHYYNGDHLSYELEAADSLIEICENLKSNANFEEVAAVIDSVMLNSPNANLFSDLNTKSKMLEDLQSIFEGPGDSAHQNFFLVAAISDVLSLFKSTKQKLREQTLNDTSAIGGTSKKFSSEFVSSEGRSGFKQLQNQTHLVGCFKKLEFYLSFLKFRYNQNEWPVRWEIL